MTRLIVVAESGFLTDALATSKPGTALNSVYVNNMKSGQTFAASIEDMSKTILAETGTAGIMNEQEFVSRVTLRT